MSLSENGKRRIASFSFGTIAANGLNFSVPSLIAKLQAAVSHETFFSMVADLLRGVLADARLTCGRHRAWRLSLTLGHSSWNNAHVARTSRSCAPESFKCGK